MSSFSITVSKSADKAILGDNPYTLTFQYTEGTGEQFYSVELQRKRDSGSAEAFDTIVTFQNPTSPINVTYQDTSLESRSVATKPTEQSKTATFQFTRVECNDKATYRWNAFYTDGINRYESKTLSVIVRGKIVF